MRALGRRRRSSRRTRSRARVVHGPGQRARLPERNGRRAPSCRWNHRWRPAASGGARGRRRRAPRASSMPSRGRAGNQTTAAPGSRVSRDAPGLARRPRVAAATRRRLVTARAPRAPASCHALLRGARRRWAARYPSRIRRARATRPTRAPAAAFAPRASASPVRRSRRRRGRSPTAGAGHLPGCGLRDGAVRGSLPRRRHRRRSIAHSEQACARSRHRRRFLARRQGLPGLAGARPLSRRGVAARRARPTCDMYGICCGPWTSPTGRTSRKSRSKRPLWTTSTVGKRRRRLPGDEAGRRLEHGAAG